VHSRIHQLLTELRNSFSAKSVANVKNAGPNDNC